MNHFTLQYIHVYIMTSKTASVQTLLTRSLTDDDEKLNVIIWNVKHDIHTYCETATQLMEIHSLSFSLSLSRMMNIHRFTCWDEERARESHLLPLLVIFFSCQVCYNRTCYSFIFAFLWHYLRICASHVVIALERLLNMIQITVIIEIEWSNWLP